MKTKIYKVLKRVAVVLVMAAFLAPFPVPYLYKLDRELVGEGTFVSHYSEYQPRPHRKHSTLVNHFRYYNQMSNRWEVLDMDGVDNSYLLPETLTAGQHIYVYAVGPLKWTAATTVKDDLRGVFFMRVMIEFTVRAFFMVMGIICFLMFRSNGNGGGGGLNPTSMLLLTTASRF